MKIKSEQDMLDFGEKFADYLMGRVTDLEGIPQSTRRVELREGKVRQDPPLSMIIELIGDVGAGKTTFVRGLAKGLGIKKTVTSPSFTISKSYALKNGGNLIHYDYYRLDNPGLMSEDLQENLLNPKNIIIIEWSSSIKQLLPKNRIIIEFTKNDDDTREVAIIRNSRNSTFRGLSEAAAESEGASPVKTGATKRVEKGVIRLFLDTSTPETILKINNKEYKYVFDKDLAEKLLQFIHDKLQENHKDWHDITEIIFMSGPGSFTGLRIGATIVNTLAHELNIPLYDHHGKKHPIIIPEYGHGANISKPRK